jgi:hypothetical protein
MRCARDCREGRQLRELRARKEERWMLSSRIPVEAIPIKSVVAGSNPAPSISEVQE